MSVAVKSSELHVKHMKTETCNNLLLISKLDFPFNNHSMFDRCSVWSVYFLCFHFHVLDRSCHTEHQLNITRGFIQYLLITIADCIIAFIIRHKGSYILVQGHFYRVFFSVLSIFLFHFSNASIFF